MDQNEYGNGYEQSNVNSYEQQYGSQPNVNSYEQQYGNQSNINSYGQQYSNNYGQPPQNSSFGGVEVTLPESVTEHMPEWLKEKAKDNLAWMEQERQRGLSYGGVEPVKYKNPLHPIVSAIAWIIGLGGAFFFIFFMKTNGMAALLCIGIMVSIFGIGAVTGKKYSFRRFPNYMLELVLGVIMILTAAYYLLAGYIPSLPQPESKDFKFWIGAFFIVLAIALCILEIISSILMKKVCTERVPAFCVYVKRIRTGGSGKNSSTRFIPVYEFQMMGRTYCVAEDNRDKSVPQVGGSYDLCLNPNDPTDFYRVTDWGEKITIFLRKLIFFSIAIVMGGLCCLGYF